MEIRFECILLPGKVEIWNFTHLDFLVELFL